MWKMSLSVRIPDYVKTIEYTSTRTVFAKRDVLI
jgi:hypothetical protein